MTHPSPTSSAPASPNLPRFSDPKDIDDFVAKLEAYERGELTPDQFRAFRLLRGTYGQRQEDVHMIRAKIPFGMLGPEQLRALADIAEQHSRGIGHVTTRQNIQFHFVPLERVEAAMRRLDDVGITTREACGNSARTVTACEIASVCTGAPFDVTPYAEAMTRYFLRHPLSGGLPRKFKTAFSGCDNDCAMAAINDLGFIAKVKDGERGFRVLVAGGLSTTPQAAITLHEFVPAGEIHRVGEAILRLFDALGNRSNKARARLKYVLRKLGEEAFRAKYQEVRDLVDAEASGELRLPKERVNPPHPPIAPPATRSPGYLAWRAASVKDQRQDGYAAVYVRLFLGDLTTAQFRALASLLERFGDGTLRTTIDQNLLLPWVDVRSLSALHAELDALGLARLGLHTAHDVTSCPGADSCNLAVTTSRGLAAAISLRLEAPDAKDLAAIEGTVIKISGCPNSCGQHHVADIGWHGGAKTFGTETSPVYQLHLGGGVDGDGAKFGRQVVKVLARRAPEATVLLMKLYEIERAEGETVRAFFRRVDAKKVQALLLPLGSAPTKEDLVDIGETSGFVVDTKDGECAA